jgi:ABC-type nitrate/sulfonate/bicarbonate transport system substrate-binding protein
MSGILRRLFLFTFLVTSAAASVAEEPRSRSIIRLSYIPGNAALPVLVGIEHGMFAREGLSVSIVPVTDEGTIMRSLAAGATDFAIGSQSVLLSAAQNKIDARVVAIASSSRDIELVVPVWDTATKSLADIKGKTILLLNGIHNFDAVPELYRALALSKPAMRLSDINIQFIALANLEQIFHPDFRKIYVQRKVGGIFMFREYSSRHVDDKKARVIANDADVTKLIGRRGAQPLFASKLILDRDPKAVERFVRGWARSLQQINDTAHRPAVVRTLQIYYLRQHGGILKKETAEQYVTAAKYDRLVWTDQDTAEATINGKALSAARNILFASIKDPAKRPFGAVPDVKGFIDSTFATKALDDLETEKKAIAAKPPENGNPPAPEAAAPKKAEGDKPQGDAPAKKEEKPAAPPAATAPKPN